MEGHRLASNAGRLVAALALAAPLVACSSTGDATSRAGESPGTNMLAPIACTPDPSEEEPEELGEADEEDMPTADVRPSGGQDCVASRVDGLIDLPTLSAVTVDGRADEWTAVKPTIAGDGESGVLKLAVDCDNLYVLVQGSGLAATTQLLIDSDGDPASGEPLDLRDPWAASGADLLVINDWFATHDNVKWNWLPAPTAGQAKRAGNTIEYRIAIRQLGGSIPMRFGLVFRNIVIDSATTKDTVRDQLPAKGMWRIPHRYEHRGMIVPGYLEVDDDEGWKTLGEAASIVAGGGHDFWVAITGANSGPHDITPALLERWHALHARGAKLFAYVGTCIHDKSDSKKTEHGCDGLREREAVVNDAETWQKIIRDWNAAQKPTDAGEKPRGPLDLAGIWIDEFYPNRDIEARRAAGEEPARDDANQIEVEGTYYERLTDALRGVQRGWKLIGNAGGRFQSDQLNFAKLVDVACTFEDDVGRSKPWRDGAKSGPGLPIQLVRPRYGQLALVHNNQSQMEQVVTDVFAAGYSHVYTTDVPHSKPDGTLNELWNSAPMYLLEQARFVKAHLAASGRK